MSKIIQKNWYLFIAVAMAFTITVIAAQAALICGDTVCWQLPLVPAATDNTYVGTTTVYSAHVDYEEEDVFNFGKEGYYSSDGGFSWLPATLRQNRRSSISTILYPSSTPDIAQLNDGRFVFVWSERLGVNTASISNVYFVVKNAAGANLTAVTRIDPNTTLSNNRPRVSALADGGFVVVWSRFSVGYNNTYVQQYDANATPVGSVSLVNENVVGVSYDNPEVAGLSDGGFVVTMWRSNESQIVAKRYQAGGAPLTTVFRVDVDNYPFRPQQPQVESMSNGGFVVIWKVANFGGTFNENIRMRPYDANGNPQGDPLTISQTSTFLLEDPRVIRLSDNSLIVAWLRFTSSADGGGEFVVARGFSSQGIPLSNETEILEVPSAVSFETPFLSALPDGGFLAGLNHRLSTSYSTIVNRYASNGVTLIPVRQAIDFGEASSIKAIALPQGGLAGVSWRPNTGFIVTSGPYYLNIVDMSRTITAPSFPISGDFDLRFRLVDPATSQEWLSQTSSYIYAPTNDGQGGSVLYPNAYTNTYALNVGISMPCGSCQSLQLYIASAPLTAGACGTYSAWTAYGDNSTLKPQDENGVYQVSVDITNANCYRFRATVTNIHNRSYNYDSSNILRVDQAPPLLSFVSDELVAEQLTINVSAIDIGSAISATHYQLNDEPPTEFSGNNFSVPLPNGINRIGIIATDLAGNFTRIERFYDVAVEAPEIFINGIEEGGIYGDNAEFILNFSQPLTEIVILVDGQPRSDLVGLADGAHILTVEGRDAQNNLVTRTVNFTINRASLTLSMLSPQARTYETNTLRIQYTSSQPLTRVWYTLNGGPTQQDLTLSNLADGAYTLVLFGETAGGQTVSTTRTFSVLESVPQLQVFVPQTNEVYASNQIAVSFQSNSPVSYQLGEVTGVIQSGDILSLPQDGDHSLMLSATHPVSGNTVSQRLNFSTDTLVPTIELVSPRAELYPFREIPIEYSSNKALTNVTMTLDSQIITDPILTALTPGIHNFQIQGQDSSGRAVTQQVQFTVSYLAIVSPQDGAQVLSEALPPILPFEYDAQGSYTNFSYALDSGPQQLITGAPGTEIPIAVAPGNHEITLRGTFNEFQTVRRSSFRIGSKNITLGADSINYDYTNCNLEFTECDVAVTVKVTNTGDFDVANAIDLRFDHISQQGYQSENISVNGLLIGEDSQLTLPVLRAQLGDTFSLTVDPFATIPGEWPDDNHHQISFQVGQITGVEFSLATDNVYLKDVSVFEYITVNTAGPVQRVEYRMGDWTFIDNSASDGFESVVDMGLLSPTNSCVNIVAFGINSIALDSRTQCFGIKTLGLDQVTPMQLQWSAHASGPNQVNVDTIDRRLLAIDLAQARLFALERYSSVVSTLQDNGRVVYRLLTNPAATQGRAVSQSSDLGNAPIVGSQVSLPNGHGIFITTLDLTADVCSADAAIPIVSEPRRRELSDMLQQELDDINAMFALNLTSEEEFARILLSTVGLPVYYRIPLDLDVQAYGLGDVDFGVTYIGWVWGDVPTQFVHIDVQGEVVYGFTANGCLLSEGQGGMVDVVLNAKYELSIEDGRFDLSTGRISLSTIGVAALDINSIPVLPLAVVSANVTIYPQNLRVPIEIGTEVEFTMLGRDVFIGPAHSHYKISVNHNARLARADYAVYPVFLLGLGAGEEFKADISLNGIGETDWVGGQDTNELYTYTNYNGRVEVRKRKQYCLLFACYKTSWSLDSVPYNESIEHGIPYTDEEVAATLAATEPFVDTNISDLEYLGLYYLLTGDTQLAEEYLNCGLYQSITTSMSNAPMYSLESGSCQLIQSPDSGFYTEMYTDPGCVTRAPYRPTPFFEYCQNNLTVNQSNFVGNSNAWEHSGDPAYDSIGKNSRWTLSHGARFDIYALSQTGNRRPFVKQAEYKNVNNCALEMRVFKQDIFGQDLKPMMFLHGGSWKYRGAGAVAMESTISHFTERGYIVFTPYYRLMGTADGPAACQNTLGEDIVSDVEDALRWVKLHGPTLGASNLDVTLVGQSAGSHLATWLSAHETLGADVRNSLLLYPPTDLEYFVLESAPGRRFANYSQSKNLVAEFFTGQLDIEVLDRTNLPLFVQQNGVTRRITEGTAFAPTFMIHGNQDSVVPIQSSTRLCEALAGVPFDSIPLNGGRYPCGTESELHIIDGAEHVLDLKCFSANINPRILEFLQNNVGFETVKACPSGQAGAAVTRSALESALQWLN